MGAVAGTEWLVKRDEHGPLYVNSRTKATVFDAPAEVAAAVASAPAAPRAAPLDGVAIVNAGVAVLKAGPAVVVRVDGGSSGGGGLVKAEEAKVKMLSSKLPTKPPPRLE